jgi:diketogulonate reductase-like aldo/keto reductase
MASPRLTCIVTGRGRPTTYDYLQKKANRLGVSVAQLQTNYISREAVTQINAGTTAADLAERYGNESFAKTWPKDKTLEEVIALNSRGKAGKRNVTAKTDVETVVVESKLSPETVAYENTKAELIGKEAVAAIKEKVWDEPLAEEGIYVQVEN